MTADRIVDEDELPNEPCDVPENYLDPDQGELAARASPPVDVPLPLPSDGLYAYYNESKRFGIAEVVAALVETGRIWKLRSNRPDIGIGDISKRGGGQIPGHTSHRKGIDVDIRPLMKNGEVGPVTFRDQTYSRELSQELADLLHANGKLAVQFILFDDPDVKGAQPYPNHDNHLHVRFLTPGSASSLPEMTLGSRHAAIREMQRRLNFWLATAGEQGVAGLDVDGHFGSATLMAVKAFQRSIGVPADGRIGADTWARLPLASRSDAIT